MRFRVLELSDRLAAVDDRFSDWAEAIGVECAPLEAAEKNDMIHELDADVAHLYGLKEEQLVHIFETFHEGWELRRSAQGHAQALRGVEGEDVNAAPEFDTG